MLLNPLTLHTPKNLEEALNLHSTLENAKIQAGGTFLMNSLKLLKRNGAKTPQHVIALHKVPELKGILATPSELSIKAMTTIAELFESGDLKDNFAVLKTVCRNISTQPIRNTATVGGNLTCRYTWTEMPAVMIGLDAQLHFLDKDKKESILSAEEFFKAQAKTDKLFTHLTIKRDPAASIAYQRVKKTMHMDIPLLSLIIHTNIIGKKFTRTRVAVNNCVNFARRDSKLEEFLNGKTCSPTIAEEALNYLDTAIYDVRSEDYKKHMFRVSIKKALNEIIQ